MNSRKKDIELGQREATFASERFESRERTEKLVLGGTQLLKRRAPFVFADDSAKILVVMRPDFKNKEQLVIPYSTALPVEEAEQIAADLWIALR